MPSTTLRATVYRIAGVRPTMEGMFDATTSGRLAGSGVDFHAFEIAGAPAILYHSQRGTTEPAWCPRLSQLTGLPLALLRQEAEAVLVIAVDGHVYALGFGQGYLSISGIKERGFGLRCALRTVDPGQVQDVVRRAIGGFSRQDSTMAPGGIPIGVVGVRGYTELVKRLGGLIKAADLGLNHRESISVEGGDGLRLPIPLEQVKFLALLRRLNEIRDRQVRPEFESLEAIQPVGDEALSQRLDALLDEGLRESGDIRVQLVIPADLGERRHGCRSYLIKVGSVPIVRDELDLVDLRERCKVQYSRTPVAALREGRVDMCSDGEGTQSIGHTSAIRWIEAIVPIGPRVYQLSDGEWYECGTVYLDSIKRRMRELVVEQPELAMLPWHPDETEEDYNKRMQRHFGPATYVCLDRYLVRTPQHSRGRGMEACDGITDRHTLVHVKAAASSEPLGHQFNQALISTQALYEEPEARAKFSTAVSRLSGGQLTVPEDFRPEKVILAILLKDKELTHDSLYPFAQVALVNLADTLMRQYGVTVEVAAIPVESAHDTEVA
ncbi:DUF6119 family protein [Nonomuraea rubra]|uniref:Uncharacterized protein (TIGR04141 family) n=1 Tax=Nonomuraea rubra TaxID=46180 RepID=A0A7X0NLZ3_9ACTN|nr:DUF6119 family protein [Nonomuraea rubra]MBB6545854.1 uncharacterized protein (TIGR04141 family) [Nonomuraea rubra]